MTFNFKSYAPWGSALLIIVIIIIINTSQFLSKEVEGGAYPTAGTQ